MRRFSAIKEGEISVRSIPHVRGVWHWHFSYFADTDPNTDITQAGGLIDPDERTDAFSGRVMSAHLDTKADLEAVQRGLRNKGWAEVE